MTSGKIRLLMIDDHELFRDGLSLFLKMQSDVEVLAAASSPRELHQLLSQHEADILLMDIGLPQQSGIDLSRQLLKEYPKLKIIFLSGNEGQAYIEQSLKAGGKGFVPKSAPKTEVLDAVRKVDQGQFYFPEGLAQGIFQQYISQLHLQTDASTVTERELEVLRCFANGMSFKEIEDHLHISKKTIEHHKKAIFDKLGFSSNADLVKYAIKNNIIEL
ncbi:MAG: response regulator transcription factor [Imperialibacter sp.]|uniref:response regulator transcription factor n=1 Tax=Imperialibacter sp. TaxID=2038411 RepID=UPI0032ED5B74